MSQCAQLCQPPKGLNFIEKAVLKRQWIWAPASHNLIEERLISNKGGATLPQARL